MNEWMNEYTYILILTYFLYYYGILYTLNMTIGMNTHTFLVVNVLEGILNINVMK